MSIINSPPAILSVICLCLGFVQAYNEFHLTGRQGSDWYNGNDGYQSGHVDGVYRGSEWPEYRMCPPSMDEVGRATWVFMHSVAAQFPENPTEKDQNQMKQLLELINVFYPYPVHHIFYNSMMNNQPDATSGQSLSQWMCHVHNKVNTGMGKPEFDCSFVDERWRDGRCN